MRSNTHLHNASTLQRTPETVETFWSFQTYLLQRLGCWCSELFKCHVLSVASFFMSSSSTWSTNTPGDFVPSTQTNSRIQTVFLIWLSMQHPLFLPLLFSNQTCFCKLLIAVLVLLTLPCFFVFLVLFPPPSVFLSLNGFSLQILPQC